MGEPQFGTVTGLAEPEEVNELDVTDAVLPLLKVQPLLGRVFSRADDSQGSPETVILTFGYWKMRFGGDRSVIGRNMLINGRPIQIVGVLPQTFRFLDLKPALLEPMRRDRNKTFLGNFSFQA